MTDKRRTLLVITLMVVGIGVMAYPVLSNYVNLVNGSYAIQELSAQLDDLALDELSHQRQLAEEYNAGLTGDLDGDAFGGQPHPGIQESYYDIMEFGNGIMGCIQIPDIGVELPIYHGVEENVLQKGAGHMPQSAFPIGGLGNHTVLTGHTGLPSAQLFTELTQLGEGSLFYISILGETLAYQVDQIHVVLPEETELLAPVAGYDHCTLVTCTPYGINSHRLLVRGTRVDLDPEVMQQHTESVANKGKTIPLTLLTAVSAEIALILAAIWILTRQESDNANLQTDEGDLHEIP